MPAEMVMPAVAPWMKERGDLTCLAVDSSEIWALVSIASRASQCKVHQAALPAVLAGNDVVNLEG
jgi:hypothetical protein